MGITSATLAVIVGLVMMALGFFVGDGGFDVMDDEEEEEEEMAVEWGNIRSKCDSLDKMIHEAVVRDMGR